MIIRPVLALVIAALLIVFVDQYARFTDRIRPEPMSFTEKAATGEYVVTIVSTCDLQGNDFGSDAISVQFRDKVLVSDPGPIAAGQVIEISDVQDIKVGLNEFLILATPMESELSSAFSLDPAEDKNSSIARAVKIEITRDGTLLGNAIVWSNQHGPFSELLRIQVDER